MVDYFGEIALARTSCELPLSIYNVHVCGPQSHTHKAVKGVRMHSCNNGLMPGKNSYEGGDEKQTFNKIIVA